MICCSCSECMYVSGRVIPVFGTARSRVACTCMNVWFLDDAKHGAPQNAGVVSKLSRAGHAHLFVAPCGGCLRSLQSNLGDRLVLLMLHEREEGLKGFLRQLGVLLTHKVTTVTNERDGAQHD
jgi:hypothetical protein